jgi:DNA-binding protein Fis
VKRLERATRRLADAESEFNAALLDLLQNGPHGSQQTATQITGMNRDTLRRRVRAAEQEGAAA